MTECLADTCVQLSGGPMNLLRLLIYIAILAAIFALFVLAAAIKDNRHS